MPYSGRSSIRKEKNVMLGNLLQTTICSTSIGNISKKIMLPETTRAGTTDDEHKSGRGLQNGITTGIAGHQQ